MTNETIVESTASAVPITWEDPANAREQLATYAGPLTPVGTHARIPVVVQIDIGVMDRHGGRGRVYGPYRTALWCWDSERGADVWLELATGGLPLHGVQAWALLA